MDIKIIGGGPAGLAVAYYAKKRNLSFQVYESSNLVGGNCRTVSFDQFKYDLGAHRFHDKDENVTKEIKELLGDNLIKVDSPSKIYYEGKMVNFPLEFSNIFQMFDYSQILKIFMENLYYRMKVNKTPRNFKELAYQNYGKTLSNLFLINYTEKLWGDYCQNLDSTISGKRLKNLNLHAVLMSLFNNHTKEAEHLDGSFYYPVKGFGDIFESMKNFIGINQFSFNSIITGIIHDGKKIKYINQFNKVAEDLDHLFCTIPLNVIINILQPAPPKEIIDIVNQIQFRSLRLCILTLNQEMYTENASIYFPDSKFPFTRIYEPKNRSNSMAPEDKTCIVIEVPCNSNELIYKLPENDFIEHIKSVLIDNDLVDSNNIISSTSKKMEYAYPILSIETKAKVDTVLNYLNKFENLHLIGRSAQFRYLHTHDLFRFANNQVDHIIN